MAFEKGAETVATDEGGSRGCSIVGFRIAWAERPPGRCGARRSRLVQTRSAVRKLGGGHRYEVFLVWDGRLFALVVAKVLRPHLAAEQR